MSSSELPRCSLLRRIRPCHDHPPRRRPPPIPRPGLRRAVRVLSATGALVFLVAVVVHPARDGAHIAQAPRWYELTHSVEAVGLLLQILALAAVGTLAADRLPGRDLRGLFAALLGTTWYFGLIVVDGTRNPVTARYAPGLVHTGPDLDLSTAVIVLPALVLLPLGHAVFGAALARNPCPSDRGVAGRRGTRVPPRRSGHLRCRAHLGAGGEPRDPRRRPVLRRLHADGRSLDEEAGALVLTVGPAGPSLRRPPAAEDRRRTAGRRTARRTRTDTRPTTR
jgi:hypothetical protein